MGCDQLLATFQGLSKKIFTSALGQGINLEAFIRKQLKLVCGVIQHSCWQWWMYFPYASLIWVYVVTCFHGGGKKGHFDFIMANFFLFFFLFSVGKE